jgi:hypothetical protein
VTGRAESFIKQLSVLAERRPLRATAGRAAKPCLAHDFFQDRTHDERVFRTLKALVIRVKRRLNLVDVVNALTDPFILRGPPEFIRSDNGA